MLLYCIILCIRGVSNPSERCPSRCPPARGRRMADAAGAPSLTSLLAEAAYLFELSLWIFIIIISSSSSSGSSSSSSIVISFITISIIISISISAIVIINIIIMFIIISSSRT